MVKQTCEALHPLIHVTHLFNRSVLRSVCRAVVRSYVRAFVYVFVLSPLRRSFTQHHFAVSSVSLHSIKQHLPVLSSFLFSVFYLSSWLQHTLYAFSSDTTEDLNKDKNCVVD